MNLSLKKLVNVINWCNRYGLLNQLLLELNHICVYDELANYDVQSITVIRNNNKITIDGYILVLYDYTADNCMKLKISSTGITYVD
jgi:hypothetical protein